MVKKTKQPRTQKKIRMSLDLTRESFDRLDVLQKKIEAESKAAVVRNSLKVYEWLIEEFDAGTEFFTRKEGEEITRVKIFG
jgi:hypothetical protein